MTCSLAALLSLPQDCQACLYDSPLHFQDLKPYGLATKVCGKKERKDKGRKEGSGRQRVSLSNVPKAPYPGRAHCERSILCLRAPFWGSSPKPSRLFVPPQARSSRAWPRRPCICLPQQWCCVLSATPTPSSRLLLLSWLE